MVFSKKKEVIDEEYRYLIDKVSKQHLELVTLIYDLKKENDSLRKQYENLLVFLNDKVLNLETSVQKNEENIENLAKANEALSETLDSLVETIKGQKKSFIEDKPTPKDFAEMFSVEQEELNINGE